MGIRHRLLAGILKISATHSLTDFRLSSNIEFPDRVKQNK